MFVRLMAAVLRFQSIIHRDENTEISLSCTCPPLASCLNISAAISTSPPHRQLPVTSPPLTTFQSLMTPIECRDKEPSILESRTRTLLRLSILVLDKEDSTTAQRLFKRLSSTLDTMASKTVDMFSYYFDISDFLPDGSIYLHYFIP